MPGWPFRLDTRFLGAALAFLVEAAFVLPVLADFDLAGAFFGEAPAEGGDPLGRAISFYPYRV